MRDEGTGTTKAYDRCGLIRNGGDGRYRTPTEPVKPEKNRKNEPEAQQKAQHFGEVGDAADGLTGSNLAEALVMLAKLPFTDDERAEAVRRLLEQATTQP